MLSAELRYAASFAAILAVFAVAFEVAASTGHRAHLSAEVTFVFLLLLGAGFAALVVWLQWWRRTGRTPSVTAGRTSVSALIAPMLLAAAALTWSGYQITHVLPTVMASHWQRGVDTLVLNGFLLLVWGRIIAPLLSRVCGKTPPASR